MCARCRWYSSRKRRETICSRRLQLDRRSNVRAEEEEEDGDEEQAVAWERAMNEKMRNRASSGRSNSEAGVAVAEVGFSFLLFVVMLLLPSTLSSPCECNSVAFDNCGIVRLGVCQDSRQ